MKIIYRIFIGMVVLGSSIGLQAQPTIYPAKPQSQSIAIVGANLHIGDGTVIENGVIVFKDGKILSVGPAGTDAAADRTIQAQGKNVYPGFIAPNSNLGLVEFESVKATLDFAEVGSNNAHVRTMSAYNTDSKVINTLRSNGILLAQITPERGLISGQSSVVQLDAWSTDDAAYNEDEGLHVQWPEIRMSRFATPSNLKKQQEAQREQIEGLISFLAQSKAYNQGTKEVENARMSALNKLYKGESKLYVHVNEAGNIIEAVQKLTALGLKPVIVGGRDAHLVTTVLKDNQVPVLIRQAHSLPANEGDDVNAPYKQAKILHDAGVLAAYAMDGFWQQRNLPFMAGTAVAHGLDKETALSYITLNTAQILGIDDRTGSLTAGKDANLFISEGDALDMLGNQLEAAFIQGREIELDNLHKQLFQRYQQKYSQQ